MEKQTIENKIEKALINCRNRSKDNADLIANALLKVGQDTFEESGVDDHKMAVWMVAQCLYERVPYLDHDQTQ